MLFDICIMMLSTFLIFTYSFIQIKQSKIKYVVIVLYLYNIQRPSHYLRSDRAYSFHSNPLGNCTSRHVEADV